MRLHRLRYLKSCTQLVTIQSDQGEIIACRTSMNGRTLSDFFFTSSGPVDGDDWAISNSTDGGTPVWVDTETPASSYTPGAAGNYTIVLTTQDWVGDQQPLITIATDNDIVDPFGSNANSIGNLAAVAYFSNTSTTASEAVLYWQASTTSGDYALEFEPITTTFPASPTAGPSTVVSGSAVTMDAAIADPTGWSFNSANATSLVLAYTTAVNSTTENLRFQGFSNSGSGCYPRTSWKSLRTFRIYARPHSAWQRRLCLQVYWEMARRTGLYGGTFNDDTGALGAAEPKIFRSRRLPVLQGSDHAPHDRTAVHCGSSKASKAIIPSFRLISIRMRRLWRLRFDQRLGFVPASPRRPRIIEATTNSITRWSPMPTIIRSISNC